MKNFSELSISLTKNLNKNTKKEYGIFFTPQTIVKRCFQEIFSVKRCFKTILEPSCGSGEFLSSLLDSFPNSSITAIEKNNEIFSNILPLFPSVNVSNEDFLDFPEDKKFDLIVGNPPYFVLKKKDVKKVYHDFFDGRPNIFTLFILKSLKQLTPSGILCFVLPKSFLNCSYYEKTRKFISENFTIVSIIPLKEKFTETAQETIILTLKNEKEETPSSFTLKTNGGVIFTDQKSVLENLLQSSKTLSSLNFTVSVGDIVWNQHKEKLTDDSTKTRLIYDTKQTLSTFTNSQKKNFIELPGDRSPVLVVNRGFGTSSYKFVYCIIDGSFEYRIENHLICIKTNDENLSGDEKIKLYEKIILSFKNENTKKFIKLFFSNNAINTTELANIFPIYGF